MILISAPKSDTNAVKWLRSQGVTFDVLEYAFAKVGATHAAAAVGRSLEAVCKTLIVKSDGKTFYVAIVPGDQRFDGRKMAVAVGGRRADLAETAEAEKITGYQVGGISPFAMRRRLPVFIEESLLVLDRIVVNGGRRGVLVELATQELCRLLAAEPADICG
ncbi:MAG: aminoacyl-tRNA deacylase [bacterium]|nr:aminoacyl-tRNA deacylase [bacterium]